MSTEKSHIDKCISEGKKLQEVISALELTQKSFSESIMLARTLISEICSGKRRLKGYQALLIEKVHNVNYEFILGRSDNMFLKVEEKEKGNVEGLEEKIRELKADKENLINDKSRLNNLIDRLYKDLDLKEEEIKELKRELDDQKKGKTSA